ncbi:MAG: UDP-3-O-acyl-N-acetylglucosamine deacetylase [Caulobacterales bacterium]
MSLQHTLAAPITFAGVGLHTGREAHVTLKPAAVDAGVVFVRTDLAGPANRIRAIGEAVCQTRLGTVIGAGPDVTVSTIEHLMAAFSALGVDNVLVEVDGPEIPILDGSCAPIVAVLDRAGRRPLGAERQLIEVTQPVEIVEGEKRAALLPADQFEVSFEIHFESAAIGRQEIDLAVDEASFRDELADARSFGFMHEFDQLRAAGLARGASLDNTLVVEGGAILNPGGLRRPGEFVRHKALDAVGDLYLLGAPLIGRYEGRYAGHSLNNALVRALLARPEAWRMTTRQSDLARAV